MHDNELLVDSTPIDWRVRASELCRDCIHCCNGFCSLGFPEAEQAAFVSECVARAVEQGSCVVQ
jgi:hypothetical protein